MHITNFMGHDLIIIVVWNLFFISLYGIDTDVIHLFILFEHQCCAHYLDTNFICLIVLFKQECCMSIHVVYTWKLCTWLLCLNNSQHLCLNNTNLWNNRFHTDLEWTHEACDECQEASTLINRHSLANASMSLNMGCALHGFSLWLKLNTT
jgi:hypothetical protein